MSNEAGARTIRRGTGRTVRRPVRRGLSVAAVIAVGFAGVTALYWITHSSETVTVPETILRVEIEVASGRVDVVGSPDGETTLDFSARSGWLRDGGIDHEVDGTTLRVTGGCDSGVFLGLWCQSDVTITVPADAVVVAQVSAGTLSVSGLSAEAILESSAGDVLVSDHRGPVTAHSAAGSVELENVDASVVKATSSAGSVYVSAVTPPTSLDAESSAGDVTVEVPDDVTYDVETDSSIGDARVEVPTMSGARHEIRAFSSAGSVLVTGIRQ
ncbi:DUF4097 family beta strand repeat-containing protein [Jiangella asiatica]|uniref:DUF4097 domain-containing protein n=1 Tax=Jiangella asiatica TaxID=2530372 RepID=A0A4R5CWL0_9ACTN|nr:DUF4097 family beta strand repeat-containing protein [Jiangella asiatica]TDE02203.1 hypothetical protein E1269_22025 [Jiangella asiatica]